MRLVAVLLAVLLIGCAVELENGGQPRRPVPVDEPPARPDIPRSNPPGGEDEPVYEEPAPRGTPRQIFVEGPGKAPGIELGVPLGGAIGEHHPLLTAAEFPLLRHKAALLDAATPLTYDEVLLFDFGANSTGRVRFTKSEDDAINTYLFFEEDKPILEYRLHLRAGTFRDLQGREIQVLGHTYVVADVTNRSVHLYGKDIDSNFAFANGSRLVVNSTNQQDTRVVVTPSMVSFTLYADDLDDGGILLAPGESLAERVGHNRLGSRILDIRFLGSPEQAATLVQLEQRRFGYDLILDTPDGRLEIPLVEEDAGRLVLGTAKNPLRFEPCPAAQPYCISPGTHVLLSRGERTFLLEYADASNATKELIFRSEDNRYSYEFIGEPGRDAWADVILGGAVFRARIGPRDNATGQHNISIDQGFIGRAELGVLGGSRLRIHPLNGTMLPLELITPRHGRSGEERTWLNLSHSSGLWTITAGGNVTFVEEEGTDDAFGITGYGAAVHLDRDRSDLAPNQGEEATILIPFAEKHAVVLVEG